MTLKRSPAQKALALASALTLLPLGTGLAAPVWAQSGPSQAPSAQTGETQSYDIPAGPLNQVLGRFASESGLLLSADGRLTRGLQSDGLQGEYSIEQALQQLLAGTGLNYRLAEDDTVTLVERSPNNGPLQLAPIQVGADAGGFRAERSSSATNVDAPLIETPATVNVLTGDFIDTIGAQRIEDIIQYVPGASADSVNSTANGVNIRGFSSQSLLAFGSSSFFIDGNRAPGLRYHFDQSLYERVDVLKGTSSVLFGAADPGGIVNYVSKRPEFEQRTRLEASLGSFDLARTSIDTTGPLNSAGTLAYRVIATYHDANQTVHGSNDDSSQDQRWLIKPAITWLLPTGGEFYASYEFSQRDTNDDPGIKRLADGSFTFDSDPFFGPENRREDDNHVAVVEFTQPLGEDWEFAFDGAYNHTDIVYRWDATYGAPDGSNLLGRSFGFRPDVDQDQYELNAEFNGDFQTGAMIKHNLSFGINYFESDLDIPEQFSGFISGAIDATNPVFGPTPALPATASSLSSTGEELGIYLQDFVTIGERFNVFGGLRFTDAEQTFAFNGNPTVGSDEALNYSVGVIYNHSSLLNPFASYSTSLTPQRGGLSGSGDPVPFKEGEQFEVGLKSEWFDGRLATTLSVFEIEQTNIAEGDPANPGFSILAGDQRTRGFEFEAVGNITDQISIIGGYSYLDAEFTESTTGNEGNTPRGVPEHKFSIFGEYAFTGDLKGWSAGIGFIHVGNREGDNGNTFELPTYERVDLSLAYERGPFDFRASIENAFDEDYIAGTNGFGSLQQGAPRFFTMSVGYEF